MGLFNFLRNTWNETMSGEMMNGGNLPYRAGYERVYKDLTSPSLTKKRDRKDRTPELTHDGGMK